MTKQSVKNVPTPALAFAGPGGSRSWQIRDPDQYDPENDRRRQE
jgi:hypothetical protein